MVHDFLPSLHRVVSFSSEDSKNVIRHESWSKHWYPFTFERLGVQGTDNSLPIRYNFQNYRDPVKSLDTPTKVDSFTNPFELSVNIPPLSLRIAEFYPGRVGF